MGYHISMFMNLESNVWTTHKRFLWQSGFCHAWVQGLMVMHFKSSANDL
jgi:hypothetical protein